MSFASEALVLDDVISQALKNNPRLEKLQHKIKALSLRPEQALKRFQIQFYLWGLMNVPIDTFDFDQEGMTQKTIGLDAELSLSREKVFEARYSRDRYC